MLKRELVALLLLLPLFSVNPAKASDAKAGEALFNSRACVGCHSIGSAGGATTGPNLHGITKLRSKDWLARWLKNPDSMRTDPEITKLRDQFKSDMPNLGLTDDEAGSLILYLEKQDAGH